MYASLQFMAQEHQPVKKIVKVAGKKGKLANQIKKDKPMADLKMPKLKPIAVFFLIILADCT